MTTLANRRIRREVARQQLPHVEALATRVLVRRPDYSHITVWLGEQARIEWWPGSHKWAFEFGGIHPSVHRGTVTEFIDWLKGTRH